MGADVLRRNIVHDSTFVLRMNSSVENTPTTQSRGTLEPMQREKDTQTAFETTTRFVADLTYF